MLPSTHRTFGQTSPTTPQPVRPDAHVMDPAAEPSLTGAYATVRMMLSEGWTDEARSLLQMLVATHPEMDAAWLQLLALDPAPADEIALLQGFLRHHADHRFAPAFRARLSDMQIIALLRDGTPAVTARPTTSRPPQRLGDYLVERGWVTRDQVERGVAEQRRLRAAGIEERLGTLLLREGHVSADQLATAMADASTTGFGEFGNYLVRSGVLTAMQVGEALALQAEIAAQNAKWYMRATGRVTRIPRLGEVLVRMGLMTGDQVVAILKEREASFHASFG